MSRRRDGGQATVELVLVLPIVVATVLLALAALVGPILVVFGSPGSNAAFGDAEAYGTNKVSEAEIERLKEGDVLETTFAQFADQESDLSLPLIDERDRFLAQKIRG